MLLRKMFLTFKKTSEDLVRGLLSQKPPRELDTHDSKSSSAVNPVARQRNGHHSNAMPDGRVATRNATRSFLTCLQLC